MKILRQIDELKAYRQSVSSLAFVPTMGALHQGHLSLITEAKKHAQTVLVSIYVNPLQFGPNEDFDRYPRDLMADQALLADLGVDLWVPSDADLYPLGKDAAIRVIGDQLLDLYCGASRPGFFAGVLTVLLRFFVLLQPTVLVLGEKDFQQQYLVARMIRDLGWDIKPVMAPLIREASGLAMSSRNRYLNLEQHQKALTIYQAMLAIKQAINRGVLDADSLKALFKTHLHSDLRLDYLAFINDQTFEPISQIEDQARILVAVYLDGVRLIDTLGDLN